MNEGIDLNEYRDRFDIDLKEKYASELNELSESDLIEMSDGRVRLTQKGMLYSNEVFSIFV